MNKTESLEQAEVEAEAFRKRQKDERDRHQLRRCGIEVVEHPNHEWRLYTGKLGAHTFGRQYQRWYWIVHGPTPIAVALKLYAHPVGRTDIRVAGHCGCPPPEWPWVECRDRQNRTLVSDPDGKQAVEWDRFAAKGLLPGERPVFVPDAVAAADRVYVDHYHVDSELGLYVFAETLRSHGLAS